MPEIVLKNVTKKFGGSIAVDDLNLNIQDKEFITLLGPSGCGKTTTLRMIAGLESPTTGEIYIDGKQVFSSEKGVDLSPVKRNVGFLFQNYALWPHMTVYKNIVFGLENLKWDKQAMKERVNELATLLKIEKYLERYPSELSGGQQQRVAIARTLAPKPKVLFMDEPLSNLDAKLRMDMRSELKRIHMETGSTFVYVTHDQLEAMTLSTRISLFKEGKLQQCAPPLEVYNQPVNTFVADFVGNPPMNFIEVDYQKTEGNHLLVKMAEINVAFVPNEQVDISILEGDKFILGIRPEHIANSKEQGIETTVYSSLPSGLETVFKVDLNGTIFTCVTFGGADFEIGSSMNIHFPGSNYILFDKAGRNITSGSLQFVGNRKESLYRSPVMK